MNPFLGQIVLFAGNFAPRGWAFCDGRLLAISSNSALFSILGTTYGGDGRTTFALPDLRGRTPIAPARGPGLSDYRLGERGGQESVVLNITQMPQHTHTAAGGATSNVKLSTDDAVRTTPQAGDVPAVGNFTSGIGIEKVKSFGPANNTVDGQSITSGITIGNTGGSLAHENRPPYLAVNYIIALQGTFLLEIKHIYKSQNSFWLYFFFT